MTHWRHCPACNNGFMADRPGPPYSAHHDMDGDRHHALGDAYCRVRITPADLPPRVRIFPGLSDAQVFGFLRAWMDRNYEVLWGLADNGD